MLNSALSSIALIPILAAALMGQAPSSYPGSSYPGLSETDHAIAELRQVSRELNASLKSFYTHLDETIARHDRGYRLENRRQAQGADVDLTIGPADLMSAAVQKFASFRMLAARSEEFQPAPVTDLDHIQQLLGEARKRVDASTRLLRRLLVVPAAEVDQARDAAAKARRDQLLQARATAEDAARRALLALPIDQLETSSQAETAQRAWDYLNRRLQAPKQKAEQISNPAQQKVPEIPIRLERRKRVTLINETSYRMAMTDSGIEDQYGRHVFYQEEWVQRGRSVVQLRWRVAVETATGEHILLKRYPPREQHGDLEDLYTRRDRGSLWYLEPPDDASEPTRDEMESALAEVARSREAVRSATQQFKAGVREALAQQDRLHAAAAEPAVDSGLPDGMRQTLFAIRAQMARVPAILQLEQNVQAAVSRADTAVRNLEPLAAWSNRVDKQALSGTSSPADWDRLLDRSDREIDAVRAAETEAVAALPQDMTREEERFPALERNVIVRIRRARSRNPQDQAVKCLQEVWWMGSGMPGTREVRRTVSLILIEPETGNQTRVGAGARLYKASPEDLLEEIFDEYAADEVSLGS
jgi:hypothetical protein